MLFLVIIGHITLLKLSVKLQYVVLLQHGTGLQKKIMEEE